MESVRVLSNNQYRFQRAAALFFIYIILILTALIVIFPFLWAFFASFKTYNDLFTNTTSMFPKKWIWTNYSDVFKAAPFHLYLINSVKITFFCAIGTIATSAAAAYAFARLSFPGRDVLFVAYLATLMVPKQIVLVPTFIMMSNFGLLNNHLSLILPGLFSAYGTFLLRQFFKTIPMELEEAAIIDGCGYWQRFTSIILPMSQSALVTLSIFVIVGTWNDFLFPLIFINSAKLRTITLGIALIRGDTDVWWNLIMAGTMISLLPMVLIFFFAQRFFVEGIALSGMKG